MSTGLLRVAAAQYPVAEVQDWAQLAQTLRNWVAEASAASAQLLVFPEYGAMTIAALLPSAQRGQLAAELEFVASHHDDWCQLHATLAQEYGVHLLAGSGPVRVGQQYRNRAVLFAPSGQSAGQDKWTMTRFESEHWGISPGDTLKVFDTTLGRIAINICYDVEFPLLARAQVEAGAQLILAPSCTDTTAGYWRVRVGAQARALENQCVVVQAPLVGNAAWSASVDVNVGAAGVYTPPDRGLPENGVLAKGVWNAPQWLYSTVDAQALATVRRDGQVFNHRDWGRQPGLGALPPVIVEELR